MKQNEKARESKERSPKETLKCSFYVIFFRTLFKRHVSYSGLHKKLLLYLICLQNFP